MSSEVYRTIQRAALALVTCSLVTAGLAATAQQAASGQAEQAEVPAALTGAGGATDSATADTREQAGEQAASDADDTNFRAAIERGEVLPGMTAEQVLQAQGEPSSKEVIPPDAELWQYRDGEVALSGGMVTYVSLKPPQPPPTTVPPPTSSPPVESADGVAAPRMLVGDSYVYESFDPARPQDAIRTRRTVESIDNGIVFKSLLLGKRNASPRRLLFDEEWSLAGTRDAFGDGRIYSPPLQYYDFPLFVGKTWSRSTTERRIKTGTTRYHNVTGRVEGWERINVPAGSFLGLKVVLETELVDPDKGTRHASVDTSWYVPEVRRSVKSEVIGDTGQQVIQLLNFEPGR